MKEPRVSPVGDILRAWRAFHGFSQLDLALAAEVSTRHLSFVETGRARPSREMILRLAGTLELPLRERNGLLMAAGFAPVYEERDLRDHEMAPVRSALDLILQSHEPYPAFVLDPCWNIIQSNRAHQYFLNAMLPADSDPGNPVNALHLIFRNDLLRPFVSNWDEVAQVLLLRLRRLLRIPTPDQNLRALYEELEELSGIGDLHAYQVTRSMHDILIPLTFHWKGQRFSWFSTIATIGTPQDVTLEELRIESLFPADEETDKMAKSFFLEMKSTNILSGVES